MLTYPYEILKARLTADVTELREIDWFLDQANPKDKNSMVLAAPAVYIEFLPLIPRDLGGRLQSADAEFNLHLVTENVMDSGKRMKKDQPIDHMRIFDKINKSVSNFSAKLSYLPEFVALLNTTQDQRVMNSCTRVGITPPHRMGKGLMVSVQRFSTILYDHAAAKLYTTLTPKPPIEITPDID